MEKIKMMFSGKFFKYFKWLLFILVAAYLVLVAVRVVHFLNLDKTEAQVAKIHATKLSMSDVMGDNLPPDPGVEANKTIEGIDANENGIRDDVELAVFKEYPNSAKTRAVLLQYALALQIEFIQPIINTTTVTEVITEESRADTCLADTLVPRKSPESSRSSADMEKIDTYIKFIENKQLNNEMRKQARQEFLKNLRSFGDSTNETCDIDYSKLLD
ncbi:hypothetical protein A2121_01375 [Candidatus Nomurabacteria bacterium GWB1_40_6]|uniref:Uncharacterized protein n=1 Tax=Candidatus Nomurabacteria bacterium GWB1_40_6 TaxID=1801727 RepID=A0A1F6TLX9_9BACT|nr:MAG: hypothetical protein A2121_01375 [Candidatus Nomurabacteria bacterium GWB1_40_6]